jgi:hypothetical protein
VEGKIKGRMEEQGNIFFWYFFILVQTTGLVVDDRCANHLTK